MKHRVGAVVLAAGSSSRLGEAKQLALLDGETLLDRAVRLANEAGCKPVVVVLGDGAERVRTRCSLAAARVVVNEVWTQGMSSSIRVGIVSLLHQVDGAILMTCDQPAVTSDHLRRLMMRDLAGKTASAYSRRRGIPAYFPSADLPGLLRLTGDRGARELLAEAESIELPDGELDIDTPKLLALARARYDPSYDP